MIRTAISYTGAQHKNFNPGAAMSGKITIAEVEILVDAGELSPEQIHTPGIYVQRLVQNPNVEKRIERVTTRGAR